MGKTECANKCKDGWLLDGNASGHAGAKYYPCTCDKGLQVMIRSLDPYWAESVETMVSRLQQQLAAAKKALKKCIVV
jgi:hypothetical protein